VSFIPAADGPTTSPAEVRGKQFSLLWPGGRGGFRVPDFSSRSDLHANTLTVIVDTAGNVSGGFAPAKWDSTSSFKADESLKSFVFTLKNPHDIPAKKFALRLKRSGGTLA
jgi:hypothetical protein